MGTLQLGPRDRNFPKNLLYYGYNLKNARNEKSISKIPRPCSPATFFIQIFLFFLLNSNRHKISFFNVRGFKLGHFDVSDRLFPFRTFLKLQPIILRKVGHVMA